MSVKTTVCKTCDAIGNIPVIGDIQTKAESGDFAYREYCRCRYEAVRISYHKYRPFIDEAFDVFDLKAVALVINSPRGSLAQSAAYW